MARAVSSSSLFNARLILPELLIALLACVGIVQGLSCFKCGQYNDGVGSITPCINSTATQLKECPKTSEYCIKYVSEGSTVRDCVPSCVEKALISPSEIEEVLLAHPDVLEAAVVPIPHEIDGERAMAFVQKVPGSKVTEEELVQLSSVLGEIKKLWGGVKFIEAMPKTATGKISKMPLKEIAKTLANNK